MTLEDPGGASSRRSNAHRRLGELRRELTVLAIGGRGPRYFAKSVWYVVLSTFYGVTLGVYR